MSPEEKLEALGVRLLAPTPLENEGAESRPTSSPKRNGASRPNQQRSVADEAQIEHKVGELSELNGLKYATERRAAAAELGIPVNLLDRMVRDKRPREDTAQGRTIAFPAVEPWFESVDGASRPNQQRCVADEAQIEYKVGELSELSSLKYATERRAAAAKLGIPVNLLDRMVRDKRPREDTAQGRAIAFPAVEPWFEPVDGARLLDECVATLRRYVVLRAVQADAISLWALFTHAFDAFDVSPRLVVKSPQKRSGKTTLFSVLQRIVAKPRGASGITSSALLRVIELHQPTILIDEMDALMHSDREMAQALRGLMNSGFNRTFATYTMNVPIRDGGYEPRDFSTWCPLALAGIGHLPDTIRDRSIEIEMQRKLSHEKIKRLRRHDGADLDELARKLTRCSDDNVDALRKARPQMPDGLNDRAADTWEPLIAIADIAGGDWPARARAAALALSGENSAKDDDIDTLLFSDIRDAFDHFGDDRLSSEDLIRYLAGLEARPWAEWSHGKSMSKFQLSKRLKNYAIVSGTIRTRKGNETPKGYHRKAFDDAFGRYLPGPVSTRHIVTSSEKQGQSSSFELATTSDLGESKKADFFSNSNSCADVASSTRHPDGQGGGSNGASPTLRSEVLRI